MEKEKRTIRQSRILFPPNANVSRPSYLVDLGCDVAVRKQLVIYDKEKHQTRAIPWGIATKLLQLEEMLNKVGLEITKRAEPEYSTAKKEFQKKFGLELRFERNSSRYIKWVDVSAPIEHDSKKEYEEKIVALRKAMMKIPGLKRCRISNCWTRTECDTSEFFI